MILMLVGLLSGFDPYLSISIIAFIVIVIINVCYKYLMNQNEVKEIKEKIKKLTEEWKEKKETEEGKKLMEEIMKLNNKLMTMMFKPMIVSMIIIILILPGLANMYGNISAKDSVVIYGTNYTIKKSDGLVTIGTFECKVPCRIRIGKSFWNIYKKEDTIEFERIVALLPITIPFFGDDLGWLAWYFISTLPWSLVIKRIMRVNI